VTPLTLDDVDLTDPDLYATGDPHAVWRFLRDTAPVFWQRQRSGPGFWAVMRYEDVRRVSREPLAFISSGGTSTMDLERPDSASLDYQIMRGTLVITDPPRHTKLRTLVNKAFTSQAVAALDPYVRRVVGQILDDVAARGTFDFVAAVASRLPFVVICEMLGVPDADRAGLFASIKPMLATEIDLAADTMLNPMGAAHGLIEYIGAMIDERGYRPREDLVSGVVGAELDGERLTRAEVLALCILLFIAGSETTMNAISGGMLAFFEHPEERERLAHDGALMPTAVEEILRWTSPTTVSMVRTATSEASLGDQRVAVGDKVTLWYGSANRDDAMFSEPDRFDVGRAPNDHVAFGYGAHFCLGAQLARLELRVIFSELFERLPDLRLAGEARRLRSNIFTGLERLPVATR